MFGRSSERYIKEDPNQLKLDFEGQFQPEEEQIYLNTVSSRSLQVKSCGDKPTKNHPVRKLLPEHLERRQEIIEPDYLPEDAKYIGREVTEILEYIPGELYVREIIRKKYALKDGSGIFMGELPCLPLPRSNAGASLLSNLLVSKYQDHQPLYR